MCNYRSARTAFTNACIVVYHARCIHIHDTNTVAAPTGDEELTSRDAHRVLDELLDAQDKAKELGRALELPEPVLNGLCLHEDLKN